MQAFTTFFSIAAVVLAGFSVIVASIAVLQARKSRNYSHQCYEWIAKNNERSLALAEIAKLNADLVDQADLISSLNSTMKRLRSRIGMRELNARRKSEEAEGECPDPQQDPVGYKRYMRQKLHLQGVKPNGS